MAKRITKPSKRKGKISSQATERKINYDECRGRLAFSSVCDRHCLLCEWVKQELNGLIGYFKKVEELIWFDIQKDPGLDYEEVNNIAFPRPTTLPPDASLHSMRVAGRLRVYGYRADDVFNIIWFDRLHEVCPVGKPKKYAI